MARENPALGEHFGRRDPLDELLASTAVAAFFSRPVGGLAEEGRFQPEEVSREDGCRIG